MSRGLAKAAQIVGVIVAVAAAIPTGGGSTLLAAGLNISVGAASAIAAGVGLAASAISALSARKLRPATFVPHPLEGFP